LGEFLASNPMVPVVSASHPLAKVRRPLTREVIEQHVQLVLTDRTPLTEDFQGNVLGRRIWRFADMNTRLQYLLDGFGWCYMPVHVIDGHIKQRRLRHVDIAEHLGRDARDARAQPPARPRWTLAHRGVATEVAGRLSAGASVAVTDTGKTLQRVPTWMRNRGRCSICTLITDPCANSSGRLTACCCR